jgi:hypothetical protein
MAAAEANGEQKLLRSTTMIFRPTSRVLLFAVEISGSNEDGRYHTELIVDNFTSRPQTVAAPVNEPKGKVPPEKKQKKGSVKNTPGEPI